jgi:hypothetical protein
MPSKTTVALLSLTLPASTIAVASAAATRRTVRRGNSSRSVIKIWAWNADYSTHVARRAVLDPAGREFVTIFKIVVDGYEKVVHANGKLTYEGSHHNLDI